MSEAYCIPPFPSDADREAFGHWLSGFADGEATFFLGLQKSGIHIRFAISLRRDDRPILEQIRAFLCCGRIRDMPNYSNRSGPSMTIFEVTKIETLQAVIVPNFRRFPLRAKKRHDFIIWAEAVAIAWKVLQRKAVSRGSFLGTFPKWTHQDRKLFEGFHAALKEQRRFTTNRTTTDPSPKLPDLDKGRSLFD